LSEITGISPLYPDPFLYGGGLNEILPGGYLNVHTDFNFHPRLRKLRALNLLLYLNAEWEPGQLVVEVASRLEAGIRDVGTIGHQLIARWQKKDVEQAYQFLTRAHTTYAYGEWAEAPVTIDILARDPGDRYATNWFRPNLTPSPHVSRTKDGIESTGGDPYFWIDAGFAERDITRLHIMFNWTAALGVEFAQFYFDFGEGSSEALSRLCPTTEGSQLFRLHAQSTA
jgi:hypothetical protein